MKIRWHAEDTILDDVESVRRRIAARRVDEHDQVSEASEESFPASDAPSWTTTTASVAAPVNPQGDRDRRRTHPAEIRNHRGIWRADDVRKS